MTKIYHQYLGRVLKLLCDQHTSPTSIDHHDVDNIVTNIFFVQVDPIKKPNGE